MAPVAALADRVTDPAALPHAVEIQRNVPVYDGQATPTPKMMAEWVRVLLPGGPGALVLRGAVADLDALNRATEIFEAIIAEEGSGAGDHFAEAGSNARIWDSLGKLCAADPEVFARYHAIPTMDALCRAWLGPGYQMTAQVNLVYPGGAAQTAHRDYHLGFMTQDQAAQYPAHIHAMCGQLTLQGGIAHCDMPIDSGPTKLLPYSQALPDGYLSYHRAEVAAFFEAHCVQLPLAKGDAIFFNPALFHGAGENRTNDVHRLANLFQVSSPFGRAMEAVDRDGMARRLYPVIAAGVVTGDKARAAVAAAVEGYAFPTVMDTDPPQGGLAPDNPAALFWRCQEAGLAAQAFEQELDAMNARKGGA